MNLRPALERNRRALPLVLAAPLLPPRRLPERPVFVIGCPRSGTTVVFELLRRAAGTRSIGQEGHVLWEPFHHPRVHGWRSNELGPDDVRSFERRYLANAIAALAKPRDAVFVEKTPRNVLRLPYLDALFPDARYVFVHRDGRAVVSSLIVAWRERSVTRDRPAYVLPEPFTIPGIPPRHWHFVLPPRWRDLNARPLEDVCAHQYVTSIEAMLEFRDRLDPSRTLELRYEDLVSRPAEELERLHRSLGLTFTDADATRARQTVRPQQGAPKWTRETPEEIARVLPTIEPTLAETGYT